MIKFRLYPYRYGFNGQEKDNEVYGDGNLTHAENWEYDTRLGRRWNLDPITKSWESSYACFNDNPIYFADPSGLDGENPKGGCEVSQADANAGKSRVGDTYTDNTGRKFENTGGVEGWQEKLPESSAPSNSLSAATTYGNTVDNGPLKMTALGAFVQDHEFVFEIKGSLNINAGLKAKDEVNILGKKIVVGLEGTLLKMDLLKASAKLDDPLNPASYDFGYAGDNNGFEKVTQGVKGGIGIFDVNYEHSWDANLRSEYGGSRNENHDFTFSFLLKDKPLISKQTQGSLINYLGNTVVKNAMRTPSVKIAAKTNASDYLFEGKAGGGLLLGIDLYLKVGFKSK